MEWSELEAQWQRLKSRVKAKWGQFTDDELQKLADKKAELITRLKHVCNVAVQDAEQQLEEFKESLKQDFLSFCKDEDQSASRGSSDSLEAQVVNAGPDQEDEAEAEPEPEPPAPPRRSARGGSRARTH